MSRTIHLVYRGSMIAIVVLVTCYLGYVGYSYYDMPLEERFYHPKHDWFKPSGIYGHGLGILGTLMILFGVSIYIARKRYNFMAKFLRLKYLLEFHIFLCTLGPILVLYHTAFKFGGIVSVAFWSMVAVVLSGVIGRFIYIQIPRTIEGRELSLGEVKGMKQELTGTLIELASGDQELEAFARSLDNKNKSDGGSVKDLKTLLNNKKVDRSRRKEMIKLVRNEIALTKRIGQLHTMQKLFKYWHVAHLPFALIMLIIVIIHVAVTLAFGYKWIF